MIKRLFVDNYKCLVNFELPLEELSLLLGPSGVGKTSVLEIVFALRRLLSGDARVTDADVFPPRTLTSWQNRNLQVFELQVVLGTETFAYRLEVEHDTDRRVARIQLEQLEVDGGPLFECIRSEVQLYRDDHSKGPAYTADWRESALARVAERHDNTSLMRFLNFMQKCWYAAFTHRASRLYRTTKARFYYAIRLTSPTGSETHSRSAQIWCPSSRTR